jgi:hypothetical protein
MTSSVYQCQPSKMGQPKTVKSRRREPYRRALPRILSSPPELSSICSSRSGHTGPSRQLTTVEFVVWRVRSSSWSAIKVRARPPPRRFPPLNDQHRRRLYQLSSIRRMPRVSETPGHEALPRDARIIALILASKVGLSFLASFPLRVRPIGSI